MPNPHKPNVAVDIKTGAEGNPPVRWQWGTPHVRDGEVWQVHPEWQGREKCTEFLIELVSNVLDYNFQSHLAMYDGLSPWCFRAHRGNDTVGVALRRKNGGGVCQVECDPGRCALYQQYVSGGREAEINGQFAKVYSAKFVSGKNLVTCKPYNFFVFRLLTPDGLKYAHPELALAMLSTHSNTTHSRIRAALQALYIATAGRMAGIRLVLRYSPFKSQHSSKPQSAWELTQPDGTSLDGLQLEAAQRRRLVDYDQLSSEQISTALVKVHADSNMRVWTAHDIPEIQERATDHLHMEQISAEHIDPASVFLVNQHPTVRALCARTKTPYAKQTSLPMVFGEDTYSCIKWLVDYARESGIWIDDILAASEFAAAFEPVAPQQPVIEPVAAPVQSTEPVAAIQEAEFVEVDNRTDEELIEAAKGRPVPPTSPYYEAPESDALFGGAK